jgi:hypothetical protein
MPSMSDFMRGSSTPKVEIDFAGLEALHGAPLGPTLVAWLRLACKLAPFAPGSAFRALGVHVLALNSAAFPWTPDDTLPLFETGGDCHHAVLLRKDRALALDRCPVLFIAEGACTAVAEDLASYLGLVAIAGVDAVTSSSDEAWHQLREDALAEVEGFAEQSEALLSLPDVTMPASPTAVVRAAERRCGPVPLAAEPKGSGLARVHDLIATGRGARAREELVRQITIMLGVADAVSPGRWRGLDLLVSWLAPELPDDVRAQLAERGVATPR